ncbi:MAG: GTP cyclohydrolase I FolE [Actinomycetia bacterium]|nr:GTP cyclohydrolase I FolE [Actinomycetes bacterium]
MDKEKIEEGIRIILEAIGEDISREGLRETPRRVANMYEEIFSGLKINPLQEIKAFFNEKHDEMIIVRDIPLYSVCEHHLLPFLGKAHVAYIPGEGGKIIGISKIARIVDIFAKRLQVQERMTTQIADTIVGAIDPLGVLVIVEAEHLCMSMRGVQKPGSITVTSAVRGAFRTSEATRAEAMSLIKQK